MSTMTVVVTRNVSPRIRGFLASTMLEMAPGVYSSPRQSPAVRERIWKVLEEWFTGEQEASIVMVWREPRMPGEQAVKTLGLPPVALVEVDGLIVTHHQMDTETAQTKWERTFSGKRAGITPG
ncbi:type I-E CRISPR-associated endoribonuclease Cas2e [Thiohalobacter sp.]|uniref:type I-E CRISPR-associated endoribonuclease Cas2e n=1 Tax=Thiohalobacter sp. TaxID=2025948 RepID=UPI00261D5BE9|nr:type I-E CRISPR-associated endoribonuclease Cas2e [Thiohalobacter sp.]